MLRGVVLLLGLLIVPLAQGQSLLDFTAEERRAILRHGPWPPPWARDGGNRVSGDAGAVALGRLLFFDAGFSPNGAVSCATCHDPARGWADGRAVARGLAEVTRNAPAVADTGWNRWFGWDGAKDSLWASSLLPLLDPREIGATPESIAGHVRRTPDLICRYRGVFGEAPGEDAVLVVVNVAKALAAFQETIVSARTPFDEFRDALARGDDAVASRYPLAAQRGLRLFVGRGNCALCHHGPRFTNGEFSDVGVPHFVARGVVDPGRSGGLRALRASPWSRVGAYSDARDDEAARASVSAEPTHRNFGEFKVPTLRELVRTAPYMHAGSHGTLRDVVRHYSEIDLDRLHADGEQILRPLRLDDGAIDDLVAFLQSLSASKPPRSHAADMGPCR